MTLYCLQPAAGQPSAGILQLCLHCASCCMGTAGTTLQWSGTTSRQSAALHPAGWARRCTSSPVGTQQQKPLPVCCFPSTLTLLCPACSWLVKWHHTPRMPAAASSMFLLPVVVHPGAQAAFIGLQLAGREPQCTHLLPSLSLPASATHCPSCSWLGKPPRRPSCDLVHFCSAWLSMSSYSSSPASPCCSA